MNLNLAVRSGVVAALLAAASIPAFATSVTPPAAGPTPVPGLGNGGLIVEVWDATTSTSLAEWLGPDVGSIGSTSASPETLDYGILGGASTFNSLFSASEVAAGDVQFVVEAVNDAAPAKPIADVTVATLGTIRGNALGTFASAINTGIASILNGSTACNNANPCTATSSGASTYAVTDLGQTAIGAAKVSGIAGGAALSFYQITNPTGSATAILSPVQFASAGGGATWTLSATGDLVYDVPGVAAVPLPAAVWLLGSGLLGLAGIGRRKLAAA